MLQTRRGMTIVVVGAAALLLIGALLLWLFLRPQPAQPTLLVLVDASARMELPFAGGSGNRFAAAQNFVGELARGSNTSSTLGLRVFGAGAGDDPCRDTNLLVQIADGTQAEIRRELAGVQPTAGDAGLTAAVIAAIRDLAGLENEGPFRLIIVTGGADTCTSAQSERLIEQEIARAGIEVDTLIINLDEGEESALALKDLLAEMGQGVYIEARDEASLLRIATSLPEVVNDESTKFEDVVEETDLPDTTVQVTATPVEEATNTVAAATPTTTFTPTLTPTPEPSATATESATATPSPSSTLTATATGTSTPTRTPTRRPSTTPTATPTLTLSPVPPPTDAPSIPATNTHTPIPPATATLIPTTTPTASRTGTPTMTATATPTPSSTPTSAPSLPNSLFWTQTSGIWRSPTSTSAPTLIVPYAGGELGGITVDSVGQRIYWGDFGNGSFFSANLDGTNVTALLPGESANSLTYDDGYLFWHDGSSVYRYLVGTGPVQTLVTGCPQGQINVDGVNNQLYWGDCSGTFSRMNYNSTNQQVLLYEIDVKGLVLTSQLYFSRLESQDSLYSADLDGNSQQLLLESIDIKELAIDVSNNGIFWASPYDSQVYRANLDGSGAAPFISAGGNGPNSLTVYVNTQ